MIRPSAFPDASGFYRRAMAKAGRDLVKARRAGVGESAISESYAAAVAEISARTFPARSRLVSVPISPVSRPRASISAIEEVVRARAKSPRLTNAHLLGMARGKPCLLLSPICNHDFDTTVACHGAGIANGKGLGYKLSDFMTCWGCSACNDYTDAYKHATAEEKTAVFVAGYDRQLAEWAQIAADPVATAKDRKAAQWALDGWREYQRIKGTPNV